MGRLLRCGACSLPCSPHPRDGDGSAGRFPEPPAGGASRDAARPRSTRCRRDWAVCAAARRRAISTPRRSCCSSTRPAASPTSMEQIIKAELAARTPRSSSYVWPEGRPRRPAPARRSCRRRRRSALADDERRSRSRSARPARTSAATCAEDHQRRTCQVRARSPASTARRRAGPGRGGRHRSAGLPGVPRNWTAAPRAVSAHVADVVAPVAWRACLADRRADAPYKHLPCTSRRAHRRHESAGATGYC